MRILQTFLNERAHALPLSSNARYGKSAGEVERGRFFLQGWDMRTGGSNLFSIMMAFWRYHVRAKSLSLLKEPVRLREKGHFIALQQGRL